MLAATAKLAPAAVAALVGRNREALREFWGHNKTDALELRQILEARSAAAAPPGERAPAKEAPSQLRERETDGAASQTRGIS
jgi:hypothetical protein